MRALFIHGFPFPKDPNKAGSEKKVRFSPCSGGEVRWMEIAKRWQKKGVEIHALSTKGGAEYLKCIGLDFNYHTVSCPLEMSNFALFSRAFTSMKVPQELRGFEGIIYAPTTHIVDVLPGALIRKNNPISRFIVVEHFIASPLRQNTGIANSFLFSLSQRGGYAFAKRYADLFFAVSPHTYRDVASIRGIGPERVRCVSCGVNQTHRKTDAQTQEKKVYDAIFLKRFHRTKGVLDILKVWKIVLSKHPDAKLALVGFGTPGILSEIRRFIEMNGLMRNVFLLGRVSEEEKARLFSISRIFVHPSYEENWSIVMGEALNAGLPVVAYRLDEILEIWKAGVVWTPKGEIQAFADAVISLLSRPGHASELGKAGQRFVGSYDWDSIAEKELGYALEKTPWEDVRSDG